MYWQGTDQGQVLEGEKWVGDRMCEREGRTEVDSNVKGREREGKKWITI